MSVSLSLENIKEEELLTLYQEKDQQEKEGNNIPTSFFLGNNQESFFNDESDTDTSTAVRFLGTFIRQSDDDGDFEIDQEGFNDDFDSETNIEIPKGSIKIDEEQQEENDEVNESLSGLVRYNKTLTLEEIKNGLHGLKRTGDGYGFTFTSVRLSGRHLEDPSLVAQFFNLKSIDISNNSIKSVRNLGAMPYLQKMNASGNLIETFLDMTPVPVAVKEVDFSHNKINNELTTVRGFSELEFLQVLNLSNNKIVEIVNLGCPNLLILYLNSNCLENIAGFLFCSSLRCLNLNGNKISKVHGLKYLSELTELHLASNEIFLYLINTTSNNNIEDISEFEHLMPLQHLTRVGTVPNPITSLANWRLVLVRMLPQILWMDGQRLEPIELRAAENLFSTSPKKLEFLEHTAKLLERACQSSNIIFDDYCRNRLQSKNETQSEELS